MPIDLADGRQGVLQWGRGAEAAESLLAEAMPGFTAVLQWGRGAEAAERHTLLYVPSPGQAASMGPRR